jgi:Prealbumin-like fold domain
MASAGETARHTRRPLRAVVGLLFFLGSIALPAGAQVSKGSIGTTIEQCANNPSGIGDCTGSAWTTGSLNPQKSLYKEGDFVPFRATITNLTLGSTYALRIGYDALEDDLHAYDYLGSVDGSENAAGQKVDPCLNVAGTTGAHACGNAPSTVAIPVDGDTTIPSGTQDSGNFSAWGGALSKGAYAAPTPIDVNTKGTIERQIDVTFTAEGDTVLLAWGGHIASSLDWGAGETFVGSRSGAPFHMRLLQIQENGGSPASTGNQDLSIQGGVIAPVPAPFDTSAAPRSVVVGGTVVDTASLSGQQGSLPPSGTVDFFVCFDANATPDCSSGGDDAGLGRVLAFASSAGLDGTGSTDYVPGNAGHYCFRAEYTPSDVAPYSPTAHTNTTTECFDVTLGPPKLTVTKVCDPATDGGKFNLTVDGKPVLADAKCGDSTTPPGVTAGAHKVGESAGTNTALTDYASTIGGDCTADGSITLKAGDSKTCTITNVRNATPPTPTATLAVKKLCKPGDDGGRFDVYLDSTRFPDVTCGDSTGPVKTSVGKHSVREAAGTGTSLSDYTSVIGGDCNADGSVTLQAGDSRTCTITNTRRPPQPATLTVNKLCAPPGDSGKFDLRIDGDTAKKSVGCGGTTGAVKIDAGLHDVSEAGAGDTDLGDYSIVIGGDCNLSGEVFLQAGQSATCEITNIHKQQPAPFASLTVNKICVPAADGGLFDLRVDSQTAADEPCGGRIGPLVVPTGAHKVSETAGSGTKLTDYTSVIGGDCKADGSITLAAGEFAVCTITNVRSISPPPTPQPTPTPGPTPAPEEPTATVTVTTVCIPANGEARFEAAVDEQSFPQLACHDSTGPVVTSVGIHVVSDVATSGTSPSTYRTVYRGDCGPKGTIKLKPKGHGRCVVVHIRRPLQASLSPPNACYRLVAGPRTVRLGSGRAIVALVAIRGKPVRNAWVELTGAGVSERTLTPTKGRARFIVKLARNGILVIRARRQYGCPSAAVRRVGVIAARTPPITG